MAKICKDRNPESCKRDLKKIDVLEAAFKKSGQPKVYYIGTHGRDDKNITVDAFAHSKGVAEGRIYKQGYNGDLIEKVYTANGLRKAVRAGFSVWFKYNVYPMEW